MSDVTHLRKLQSGMLAALAVLLLALPTCFCTGWVGSWLYHRPSAQDREIFAEYKKIKTAYQQSLDAGETGKPPWEVKPTASSMAKGTGGDGKTTKTSEVKPAGPSTAKKTPLPSPDFKLETIDGFYNEWLDNGVAFAAKYKDKCLQVSGKIQYVSGSGTGRAIVSVRIPSKKTGTFFESDRFACSFEDGQILINLKKGDPIVIRGYFAGHATGGGGFALSQCEIVP